MREPRSATGRWWVRSRPPTRVLARALVAASLASLGRIALLAGSITLLVDAARRPAWLAIAVALTAIEIVAFLRSPLQFLERMATHRLGFAAVERWRVWLVARSTRWPASRWRRYSRGDLLERVLRDTETLQDLWLRAGVPLLATLLSAFVADLVIALLSPRGSWVLVGLGLLLLHAGALALGVSSLRRGGELEKRARRAAGESGALGLSLSRAAPELVALRAGEELAAALSPPLTRLDDARRRRDAHNRRVGLLVGALPALAPLALLAARPRGSGLEYALALGVALALAGEIAGVPGALSSLLAVDGVAERLEEIADEEPTGTRPLSEVGPLEVDVRWGVGEEEKSAAFRLEPGQRLAVVGPSGSGKSRLLLALSGLDTYGGSIRLSDVELRDVLEEDRGRLLAYLPPEPSLLEGYVRDVLGLSREIGRRDLARLADLGISVGVNDRLSGLSRGERARVALVRALVGSPALLVLDEPTSALGELETDRVLRLLETTSATLIVATHDERVRAWCDHVLDLALLDPSI